MIHQYKNNGYNIVLDVNSGAVHAVDEITYDIIEKADGGKSFDDIKTELKDSYSEEELDEAIKEVQGLIDDEVLFSKDLYEPFADKLPSLEPVVKALCLHVTHDCNLACKYCFAEEGEYHGERALMSLEVGKKALDFIIEHSGKRTNLEVDFFGGEPLMNWEVVKELVKYGRMREKEAGKNFRFTLTTNGVLLDDEVQEFLNKEMSNVVISLDGRKEVNDKMRPARNGKGSYDLIVPKFKKLADSRDQNNYYIRGTFTRNNLDFSEDIIHFADLGFKQISIEPVVGLPELDYTLNKEDLPGIMEEYDKLAKEYLKRRREGNGFNFFHFMIDLDQGPCIYKRMSGCGAGSEYLAVTPWGDLYPCHQFVGNKDFLLGDVFEGIKRDDLVNKFRKCNVYSKPECKDCFAKFYCSGGCAANAYNFSGDINGAYDIGCQMQRKRVECSIMIKVDEALNDDKETN